MIDVPQAALDALVGPTLSVRLRATWKLWGGNEALPVTDRIISITPFVRQISAYMAGSSVTPCSVMLDNSDGALDMGATSSHVQDAMGYLNSIMTIEEGIVGADGVTYYYPIYTGRVHQAIYSGGRVEVLMRDVMAVLLQSPIPSPYTVPLNDGTSQKDTSIVQALEDVIALSGISTTVVDTDAVTTNISNGLRDAGWILSGTVTSGVVLGDVIQGLAASCLCTAVSTESGKLRLLPEWPEFVGHDYHMWRDRPGLVFDASNSSEWTFSQIVDAIATEIVVEYQGTSVAHRDTTSEALVGRQSRRASMPFCGRGHQAMEAARILIKQYSDVAEVIGFSNHAHARLLQVGDMIRCKDPHTNREQIYRVVGKSWSREGVGISATHENQDLLDKSFAIFGTTSWGGGLL
jgi:hypothetical protein